MDSRICKYQSHDVKSLTYTFVYIQMGQLSIRQGSPSSATIRVKILTDSFYSECLRS